MKAKKILKLKKLIRHERSARAIGNLAEAEAYRKAIIALRTKHNIHEEIPLEEDADFTETDFDGEPIFTPDSPMFRRQRIIWEEVLGGTIAAYFGCQMAFRPGNNLKILIGDKANRERAKNSYLHLYKTALEKAEEYASEVAEFENKSASEMRQIKQSFLYGFTNGLTLRLGEFKAAEQKIVEMREFLGEPKPDISQALVKTNKISISEKSARLNNFLSGKSGRKPKPLPKSKINPDLIDVDGFSAGTDAGFNCAMSDEIALPIQAMSKQWIDLKTRIARKQEAEREEFISVLSIRTAAVRTSGMYRSYTVRNNEPKDVPAVQMNFKFTDEE